MLRGRQRAAHNWTNPTETSWERNVGFPSGSHRKVRSGKQNHRAKASL